MVVNILAGAVVLLGVSVGLLAWRLHTLTRGFVQSLKREGEVYRVIVQQAIATRQGFDALTKHTESHCQRLQLLETNAETGYEVLREVVQQTGTELF